MSTDEEIRAQVKKRRDAVAAKPNDGIESSSFVPFAPATTALEALDNATHGMTPDGDLLWSPAAPGQANELLSRAISGEAGVAVRLRNVRTTDVAIPVVIGSFEDAQGELDDARCLPYNTLDDDLSADGLRPLPKGRFAKAKDPYAVTLLMLGCGWVRTAAEVSYGKPTVDLGLDLPLRKLFRAQGDVQTAGALLSPFVPKPNAGATAAELAIQSASVHLGKAVATLTGATTEMDARLHDPARMKAGASHGADEWTLDKSKNGTAMACSMTLDEAFALWLSEKKKTAGTPGAGAGGFSETSSHGGSGGGPKG